MSSSSGFYWLASYPKSGNTWMRIFLTNYWHDGDPSIDINHLKGTFGINARSYFDETLQIDSGDLTVDEIDQLRPAFYRQFATVTTEANRYCKIHNAFKRAPNGDSLFPEDATLGVIYVIRSPLDIAVSYAHHNNSTIDTAIEWMGLEDHWLSLMPSMQWHQLHQYLSSWSGHVRSWVDESGLRLLVVRYEDMLFKSVETFSEVIRFIGADEDTERIERAVRASSFDVLKNQEEERGFKEKLPQSESFFRKGKAGDWRDQLTQAQIDQIVSDHHEVMARFGYLPLDA
jgi:hypothetical protein